MSHLNFDYVPLTFINDQEEIKKQIRNTLILIHLFEKYNNPVRLEKLIEGTQYGYNASALQTGKNKFLRISDIHESKVNWETVPYCNCDDEKTYLLKKDDILIARTGGTTGKSFKIDNPPAHSIYAGYLIRIRAKQEVNPDYIYLFLHSFAYWSQIVNLNERNFRPKANAENLKSLILPDCPPNVQNDAVRISNGELVKGYEELYSAIEKALAEYDKTQEVQNLLTNQLTQLENLNQAILQEAVQGKLVKQDPKEEPASELLKRIKSEKAKSGKKEKPLPPIKPEEIPFEIPENWVWCRLDDILDFRKESLRRGPFGSSITKSMFIPENSPNATKIYEQKNAIYKDFKLGNYYIDIVKHPNLKSFFASGGDIIISCAGTIGEAYLLPKESPIGIINQALLKIRLNEVVIINSYFLDFFKAVVKSKVNSDAKGSAMKNLGSIKYLRESLLIPLPPLSEQKRIVAEIEEQFAKTKQLKEHIIANKQATEQLLKALLHQSFEVREVEEINS
ncbi:MAG TPA: restriction endonuclease subunit S [Flavobacteriaceae bacterium]|nr:restriction endonuclease subunit S [Flavobacteriaceae bacterium]